MNSFTRNSPYYHLLKYLLFLLKHPVYYDLVGNINFMESWKGRGSELLAGTMTATFTRAP